MGPSTCSSRTRWPSCSPALCSECVGPALPLVAPVRPQSLPADYPLSAQDFPSFCHTPFSLHPPLCITCPSECVANPPILIDRWRPSPATAGHARKAGMANWPSHSSPTSKSPLPSGTPLLRPPQGSGAAPGSSRCPGTPLMP